MKKDQPPNSGENAMKPRGSSSRRQPPIIEAQAQDLTPTAPESPISPESSASPETTRAQSADATGPLAQSEHAAAMDAAPENPERKESAQDKLARDKPEQGQSAQKNKKSVWPLTFGLLIAVSAASWTIYNYDLLGVLAPTSENAKSESVKSESAVSTARSSASPDVKSTPSSQSTPLTADKTPGKSDDEAEPNHAPTPAVDSSTPQAKPDETAQKPTESNPAPITEKSGGAPEQKSAENQDQRGDAAHMPAAQPDTHPTPRESESSGVNEGPAAASQSSANQSPAKDSDQAKETEPARESAPAQIAQAPRVDASDTEARERLADLFAETLRLNTLVATMRQTLEQAQAKVQTLESVHAQTEASRVQLIDVSTRLQNAVAQLQNSVAQLQNSNGQTQNSLIQLQNADGRIQDSLGQLHGELQNSQMRIQDLTSQFQNSSAQTDRSLEQLQTATSHLESAFGQLQSSHGQLQNMSAQLHEALVQLQASSAESKIGLEETRALSDRRFSALSDKIADLETQFAALKARLDEPKVDERAPQAREVAPDRSFELATSQSTLAQTVAQSLADGRALGEALKALAAVGADKSALEALAPYAATPAPTPQGLSDQWTQIKPGVLKALAPPPPAKKSNDWYAPLIAKAESLVQPQPGDGRAAVDPTGQTKKIDDALARGDLAQAIAAAKDLPAAGRQAAEGWINAADAHEIARQAVRKISANALATLERGPRQ